MIVVSLLLILLSGGMLATGILDTNDGLVLASIAVSVFAAAALFLGIRQQRAQSSPADDDESTEDTDAEPDTATELPADSTARRPGGGGPSAPGDGSAAPNTAAPVLAAPDRANVVARGGVEPAGPERNGSAGTEPVAATELGQDEDLEDLDDPADEPPAELLLASEEETLSHRDDEVLVVDGRPRYHLTGCPHLADKASEPLPVAEAVELGFTPCSRCAVATTLLGAVSS